MEVEVKDKKKEEEKIKDKDGDKDILKPVVILDGPSLAKVIRGKAGNQGLSLLPPPSSLLPPKVIKGKAGNQGLGLEERLEQGWGYFHKRGYQVILFFPNKMEGKLGGLSEGVRACLRLTVREKPCTIDNPWGLDKWEVLEVAVASRATIVSNHSYTNFTFECEQFREQIEERLVAFSWQDGRFQISKPATEKAYPFLPSLSWVKAAAPEVTERQLGIQAMEERGDLSAYELVRLDNMRRMEAAEG